MMRLYLSLETGGWGLVLTQLNVPGFADTPRGSYHLEGVDAEEGKVGRQRGWEGDCGWNKNEI